MINTKKIIKEEIEQYMAEQEEDDDLFADEPEEEEENNYSFMRKSQKPKDVDNLNRPLRKLTRKEVQDLATLTIMAAGEMFEFWDERIKNDENWKHLYPVRRECQFLVAKWMSKLPSGDGWSRFLPDPIKGWEK